MNLPLALRPPWPSLVLGLVFVAVGWSAVSTPDVALQDESLFASAKSNLGEWGLGPEQPGPWLIGCGILLLALGGLRSVAAARAAIGPVLLVVSLLLGLASIVHQADELRHETMFDQDVWSLDDDMMISLRYARNLADGEGLVWNPGEKVEGITNPLWTVILAVPHWFAEPVEVSLWVIGLNALLFALLLLLTYSLVLRLGGSPLTAGLVCVALATSMAAVHWAAAGGETVLLSVFLVALARELLRPAARGALTRAAVFGGLAFWTRMDAAVVVAVLGLATWALAGDRRSKPWLRGLVVVLAFPVLLTLFRVVYYGDWLPNTYYLKARGWDGKTIAGLHYLTRWLGQHGLLLLPLGCVLFLRRRAVPLGLACLVHIAYVVSVGGDELPRQRFFVPVLPWIFALAFLGIEVLATRLAGRAEEGEADEDMAPEPAGPGGVLAAVVMLTVMGLGGATYPGLISAESSRRSQSETANAYLGLTIRQNTAPDAVVAHFWAGAAAYFSDRAGVDLLGKCDPHIARLEGHEGLVRPGHNKYDFAYSLAKEPDVVVGGIGFMTPPPMLNQMAQGPYRMFAQLHEDPTFRRLYLPNPVGRGAPASPMLQDVSKGFHGVYVRSGTQKARPAGQWGAP